MYGFHTKKNPRDPNALTTPKRWKDGANQSSKMKSEMKVIGEIGNGCRLNK